MPFIKNGMKRRTVILTGAGLTSGVDFFNISTLNLTQKIISYSHPDLSDDKEFMKFIYEEFCFWNRIDSKNIKENLDLVNFETLVHIIEELFVFIEDIERNRHKAKYRRTVKNTVFELNTRLITHINRVRIPKWKDAIYLFIEKVHNHLIDLIVETIYPYNIDGNNKGMTEFSNFLIQQIGDLSAKRIYTLNYDTWLNKFAGYFDGFTDEIINKKKIIFDRNIDCHYNLHGCILWQLFATSQKLSEPKEWKNHQSFAGYTIAREAILPSPIITGCNKLTRINLSPFLELFYSFTQDCTIADNMLIIGYGFNDNHINNILSLTPEKTKVIIVVYYGLSSLLDKSNSIHSLIFEISQIFHTNFSNLSIRAGLKYTIDSDNKKVSIFLNGIGSAFYEEYSNIIK